MQKAEIQYFKAVASNTWK